MVRQFRNVTAEQIANVAQLQRSGDEAGALQAANDIATKGFDEQTRRLKENMGTLETWADKPEGIQIDVGCHSGYRSS
ncbi:phage tail tape measure, lambda family domain protein [Escherichia coli DEC4C]|nr:phage tail tape measure, lambda family domain protein [Escherichia coli DEC4C]